MSGANSTPLGKAHPSIGSKKSSSSGGSLLKPSYMTNASNGSSAMGPAAITSAAAAAAKAAAAALAINNKREREQSPDRGSGRESREERRRKRRSRWQGDEKEKTFIPGMPTVLPANLTKDQEEAYLLQLQIEEISRRLRSNDLGIPANPDDRSPSPEPIYNNEGKRMNTREYRTRKRLEDDRHAAITRMYEINQDYKPPTDYKPPVIKVSDKVMIPQEQHPDINFVGLLIGPRGNTLKSMEKDTGAKIIIRGKGSVKEGKVGRKDGPMPGEDEPLHAFVSGTNLESVKKAVDRIKEIIRQGVEVPEGQNDLRRMQLRELALLNGTLRESDGPRCTNCGLNTHKSWQCPEKPNLTQGVICTACGGAGHIAKDCKQPKPGQAAAEGASLCPSAPVDRHKIDQEYMSLMAELGEGPPPSATSQQSQGGGASNIRGLFDRPQQTPRPLMGIAPPSMPSMMQRGNGPSNSDINPWANPGPNGGPNMMNNVSNGGQRNMMNSGPNQGGFGPNNPPNSRPNNSNGAPNLAQPPPGLSSHGGASLPPWQQQQQGSGGGQQNNGPPSILQAPPPPPPPTSQQQNQNGPPSWMNQAPPGPPGSNMGGPPMGPPQMNPWQQPQHQGGPPPGLGCPPPGPVPPPRPAGPPPAWGGGWNGPQNMGPPLHNMGGQQRGGPSGSNGVDLGALLSAPPPPPPS